MAQKAIGPDFINELIAANLAGLPFAWGGDGSIEYGEAITSDQRMAIEGVYAAHDPTKPDPRAAGAALFSGGLAITSTGTPSLSGTYGIGQQDEINVVGLQAAVAAGVFPGFYRDRAGARHTMTGTQFTEIATALLAFATAIDEALATALSGGSWTAPATTATIA